MRNLARNMIWIMRCFKLGRESGILYPETETDACTNFIKRVIRYVKPMALIGSFGIKSCMKMCYDKIDKLGFRGCE